MASGKPLPLLYPPWSHLSARIEHTFSPFLHLPAPAPPAFVYRRGPICSCSLPSLSALPVLIGRPLRPCLLFRPPSPPAHDCGLTPCGLHALRSPTLLTPLSTLQHSSLWSFSSGFPSSAASAPPISLPHTCAFPLRSTHAPKSGVYFRPPCCLPPSSFPHCLPSTLCSTLPVRSSTHARWHPLPPTPRSRGILSAGPGPSLSSALVQAFHLSPCGVAGKVQDPF